RRLTRSSSKGRGMPPARTGAQPRSNSNAGVIHNWVFTEVPQRKAAKAVDCFRHFGKQNPKSECRNPKEIRIPKRKTHPKQSLGRICGCFFRFFLVWYSGL